MDSMDSLQLFPALSAHIEDALTASIKRFGVLVPVVRDQHGRVIDGHHRSRIAEGLGVEFPVRVVEAADDDEAREIARTLNSDRRHLTEEQRREVVAELRSEGHSLRAIAGAVGTSLGTVQRDLAIVSPDTIPDRVIRQGGGSYPATRPTPESEPVEPDPEPERLDIPMPARQEVADAICADIDRRVAAPPVWSPEETDLQGRMGNGETVVVSLRGQHRNLIAWAEETGRYVRIDRRSEWGNPFETPADGDRATVIANYADHYLPYKPSLLGQIADLTGMALGCWCAPEPCHGDVLREAAEQRRAGQEVA